jgi:DNA primase catalytic subunit
MFVFSGGRGLHIWVCDKRARELKDSVRKSIVDYLELVTGNEKATSLLADKVIGKVDDNGYWKNKLKDFYSRDEAKKYYLSYNVSTHVERSLQILESWFIEIMTEQKAF